MLVYDGRYIKSKLRKFGYKDHTNFCDFNVPQDDIECKSFTIISIDYLLVYDKKFYLQVYLDNCAHKL